MNIYGLLSVIICCITALIITGLVLYYLSKSERGTKAVTYDNTVYRAADVPNADSLPTTTSTAEDKPEKEVIVNNSMDAVIAAVNTLMGVDTEEADERTR